MPDFEAAYAEARARGRAGATSRKSLRRAVELAGGHLVTDVYRRSNPRYGTDPDDTVMRCARCGQPVDRVGVWYRHPIETT